MIIDFYTHFISERVGKALSKSKYYGAGKQIPFPPENGTAETRLALMEKYGVDMQVLTQTTPVLMGLSIQEAEEICRLSNDDNYELSKRYPKKFINVSMVSLVDPKGAVKEMERCIKDLGCKGVTISSNQNGVGLDAKEYYPFYELLVEHGLPILIHPTHWDSYPLVDNDKGWMLMNLFGWPFDTSQAVWRLIFGGVFDNFPTLQVVTHHLGGMFPFYANRVIMRYERSLKGVCKRHVTEYWKDNLWGDTAVSGTKAALPCGYDFMGPQRMLFATDYPFGPEKGEAYVRECLASVKGMDIPDEEKKMILNENAIKLLKLK